MFMCYPGPAVTAAVVLAGAAQVPLRLLHGGHHSIARPTILTEFSYQVSCGGSLNVADESEATAM